MLVLISGCYKNSSSPDYEMVGASLEMQDKEPVKIDSIIIDGKTLKVREPTIINDGIVTINGRLIVNGEDTLKEVFPIKCCYINAKTFKDCDCVYGIKTELIKSFSGERS